MDQSTIQAWADHLRRLADSAPQAGPLPPAPPSFLRWRAAGDDRPPAAAPGADEQLWRALVETAEPPETVLAHPSGPLFPDAMRTQAIEVWTETELCALHALHWLAARRSAPPLRSRAMAAARWHLEHTQPDNATNRPWSAHVFLLLAMHDQIPDARLYAETLVHNCMVTSGAPDALSAHILRDASDALAAAGDQPGFLP